MEEISINRTFNSARYYYLISGFLVAKLVKNLPIMQET